MAKLIIDIDVGSNKGFVVTWYKKNPSAIAKLGGEKQEKELLAFSNAKELTDWIQKEGGK